MSHLKRRKIRCVFGTFVALQKTLTSKAKRKKNILIDFLVEKQNVLHVIKICHITEKSKQINNQRHYIQCR